MGLRLGEGYGEIPSGYRVNLGMPEGEGLHYYQPAAADAAYTAMSQLPEFEGSEGDIPDAIVDVLEAGIFADAGDGDVDPLTVPTDAAIGADGAYLEAVGVRKRWPLVGHLPGGGFIACGGGGPVERLGRALRVKLFTAVGELPPPGRCSPARRRPALPHSAFGGQRQAQLHRLAGPPARRVAAGHWGGIR